MSTALSSASAGAVQSSFLAISWKIDSKEVGKINKILSILSAFFMDCYYYCRYLGDYSVQIKGNQFSVVTGDLSISVSRFFYPVSNPAGDGRRFIVMPILTLTGNETQKEKGLLFVKAIPITSSFSEQLLDIWADAMIDSVEFVGSVSIRHKFIQAMKKAKAQGISDAPSNDEDSLALFQIFNKITCLWVGSKYR